MLVAVSTLFERRVPQIVGVYLGASWATVEFLDWIITRFGLAPVWADVAAALLVSLIPSVLVISFVHGQSG